MKEKAISKIMNIKISSYDCSVLMLKVIIDNSDASIHKHIITEQYISDTRSADTMHVMTSTYTLQIVYSCAFCRVAKVVTQLLRTITTTTLNLWRSIFLKILPGQNIRASVPTYNCLVIQILDTFNLYHNRLFGHDKNDNLLV